MAQHLWPSDLWPSGAKMEEVLRPIIEQFAVKTYGTEYPVLAGRQKDEDIVKITREVARDGNGI